MVCYREAFATRLSESFPSQVSNIEYLRMRSPVTSVGQEDLKVVKGSASYRNSQ